MTYSRPYKYHPSVGFPYFIYDPSGDGFMYFSTESERDSYAESVISEYLDEGWNEEVECVVAGKVTHSTQMVDKEERPDNLDEDTCDTEGNYWGEFDYKCGYKLLKL